MKGEKNLHLVNNFSAKRTIEGVAKIYLVFLTPNTNYVLEDMDQRVIRSLGASEYIALNINKICQMS